jgi:hypothetical protein
MTLDRFLRRIDESRITFTGTECSVPDNQLTQGFAMKPIKSIIAAALVASTTFGAYAAYAPDQGTPFNLIAAFQQDEGTPANLIASFQQDEGTPANLVA